MLPTAKPSEGAARDAALDAAGRKLAGASSHLDPLDPVGIGLADDPRRAPGTGQLDPRMVTVDRPCPDGVEPAAEQAGGQVGEVRAEIAQGVVADLVGAPRRPAV